MLKKITIGTVLLVLALATAPAWAQQESVAPSPSRASATATPGNDPTENVKALSEAANKRQDDLRIANEKLVESQLKALDKVAGMRTDASRAERHAEMARIDGEAKLRVEY